MDLRVTSILLLLVVLAEATPERYYHVKKQAYSTKSQSEFTFGVYTIPVFHHCNILSCGMLQNIYIG